MATVLMPHCSNPSERIARSAVRQFFTLLIYDFLDFSNNLWSLKAEYSPLRLNMEVLKPFLEDFWWVLHSDTHLTVSVNPLFFG